MFNRIYIGIFLSVVLALTSSYAIYSISFSDRKENYQKMALSGAMQMILDSARNQTPKQRQAYLDIVARLFGADLTQLDETDMSSVPSTIKAGSPIAVPDSRTSIRWLLPIDKNSILRFQVTAISEQQFRAHALLFVAELNRNNTEKSIEELQQYSSFPLMLVNVRTLQLDAQQISRLRRGSVVVAYNSDRQNQFSVYAPMPDGQALVLGPIDQFDQLPIKTALAMVIATVLVIVLVSGWLVFRLDSRLRVVTSTLQRFGEGETHARVKLDGHDHISELGKRINDMSNRISELIDSQRNIMQAVSHELRTPLARVRFRLEMLESELNNDSGTAKIEGVRRDLDQLEELIDEVLEHYRLTQAPKLDFSLVNLSPIIKKVRNDLEVLFPDKTIKLQLCKTSEAHINERSMSKLIQNLMNNACKHASSTVQVSLAKAKNGYLIRVEDDGPGISPVDEEKIFDAFYRSEDNEHKKTKGYGLGLAIASRVARLHGTNIELGSSQMGGACFQVSIQTEENGGKRP